MIISENMLRMPSVIHCFSLSTRMSWAAQRQTTRIEDVAYCLLGIFSVNMPLLYGEGKRAFIRLQLEIIEKSDDESIFGWQASKFPNQGSVLAEGPEDFSDSRNVVPIRLRRQTPSYSITNKGLYISLPLLHPDQLDGSCNIYMGMSLIYWGILNCRFEGKSPQYIGIPLVKMSVMGLYLRDGIHSPIEVKEEAAAEAKLEAIYDRTDGMESPFQARKFVLQLNTPSRCRIPVFGFFDCHLLIFSVRGIPNRRYRKHIRMQI